MLTSLLKTKTKITDTLYLRYDIKTMIECENLGISPFELSYPPPIEYIKAGLGDCFAELGFNEVEKAQILNELVNSFTQAELSQLIMAATVSALPPPIVGNKNADKNPDFTKLKSYFVDIMQRSDEEFFNSTLGEVIKRWDNYAVFMGYKKAPQAFCEFED